MYINGCEAWVNASLHCMQGISMIFKSMAIVYVSWSWHGVIVSLIIAIVASLLEHEKLYCIAPWCLLQKMLQVAVYMVRKLLPVVTTHHHALKTAIARNWEVEEEVDGVRIQVWYFTS